MAGRASGSTWLITGGTGFIGRRVVERLLERDDVAALHLVVRRASRGKLADLAADPRVTLVTGDLSKKLLGVKVTGFPRVDHVVHLAALYDMTASAEANEAANVVGTRNAVALANALKAGCFHHVSSIAVAGEHRGLFREDHFDEGQPLPSPYHRTKFEAEKIVREELTVPFRVYRPAVVVGDSRTGEMDKIDGPYYFFTLLKKLRHLLPAWLPLVGPELGHTNIVPVDFVADALVHIAVQPGLDGQAFHLTAPKNQRSGDVLNTFAEAAGAPQLGLRIDPKLLASLPKGVLSLLMTLPAAKDIRRTLLADLGIPDTVLEHVALVPEFDTRDTERALRGSGIEVPPLDSYAGLLWDHWARVLDPDLHKDRSFEAAVKGKKVVITGASEGIGKSAALKIAAAGGIPILVARTLSKLEVLRDEIAADGGEAFAYSCDLSDLQSIDLLVDRVLADHGHVDVLVNNAGRSIRRSVKLSYDRFHDYERTMQLNYFGTIRLIMGLLPTMCSERKGHVINISSIGVQTNPPRFSAYVASKAALDAFTRITATEVLDRGVHFTTIHMPLVRTAMIAPTKIYDSFPTITPEEAADMICDAIRTRPKAINTRLGTFGEVAYALAPKAVDQVLHLAYKVFPDSTAAKGGSDGDKQRASGEQVALAHLLKGVHW